MESRRAASTVPAVKSALRSDRTAARSIVRSGEVRRTAGTPGRFTRQANPRQTELCSGVGSFEPAECLCSYMPRLILHIKSAVGGCGRINPNLVPIGMRFYRRDRLVFLVSRVLTQDDTHRLRLHSVSTTILNAYFLTALSRKSH